ncbi:MAG: hypothetical protein N2035_09230 [Chthoniobacterales bacterium]|nr:hypothetical protein [Chthoniobacterales bacterium]
MAGCFGNNKFLVSIGQWFKESWEAFFVVAGLTGTHSGCYLPTVILIIFRVSVLTGNNPCGLTVEYRTFSAWESTACWNMEYSLRLTVELNGKPVLHLDR